MKRNYLLGCGLLLSAVVLLGVSLFLRAAPAPDVEAEVQAVVAEQAAEEAPPGPESNISGEPAEALPYASPVDFEALRAANPDIYAWLYIPDTKINYPILQREDDDSYYLTHGSDGAPSKAGAVFTESTYNARDLSDPVTVIYGHHMRSGDIFGDLQKLYSAPGGMEEHQEIRVYLPERELSWRVFAAVPFNMRHILYYHDFSDPAVFQAFLDQVLSVRSINASFDETVEVSAGDQLLILSTCLQGDSKQRYLVLAALTAEGPDS